MADIVAVLLRNVLTGNGTKKNPYALILTIAKKKLLWQIYNYNIEMVTRDSKVSTLPFIRLMKLG